MKLEEESIGITESQWIQIFLGGHAPTPPQRNTFLLKLKILPGTLDEYIHCKTTASLRFIVAGFVFKLGTNSDFLRFILSQCLSDSTHLSPSGDVVLTNGCYQNRGGQRCSLRHDIQVFPLSPPKGRDHPPVPLPGWQGGRVPPPPAVPSRTKLPRHLCQLLV